MHRAAELTCYLALLVGLALTATPRRVGDGLEYIATALNVRAGRSPALSEADKSALAPTVALWEGAPPISSLDWPDLVGRDGRQDTPHVWFYPAVVAPVLWLTDQVSWHPNHAFTAVNVMCLAAAWIALRRRASLITTALLCASPIVWWVDKAHTEVFLFALLILAFSQARGGRPSALALAGLAAAQNPGLLIVWPVVLVELLRFRRPSQAWRSIWAASGIGLGAVAVVGIYNWTRHGRLSPLAAWTAARVPSLRDWATPIVDLNIGLIPTAPFFVLGVLFVGVLTSGRDRAPVSRDSREPAARRLVSWGLTVMAISLVLAVVSQSTNMNHGGTPGLSRYALWLLPLTLPVLLGIGEVDTGRVTAASGAPADARGPAGGQLPAMAVVAMSTVASIVMFHPSRPEVYRYPSTSALYTWTHWPSLDNPTPEVFAERTSHAEPASLPTAIDGCGKALLFEASWPAPCLPQGSPPLECRQPGRLCYANQSSTGARFVVLAPAAFPLTITPRRWSDTDAFVPALSRVLAALDARTLERASVGAAGSAVRAVAGVEWSWTLQAPDRLIVFLPHPRDGASVTLRTAAGLSGVLRNLSTDLVEREIAAPVDAGDPWVVGVPPSDDSFAIVLRRVGPDR